MKYKVMRKFILNGIEYDKGDIIDLISEIGQFYKSINWLDNLPTETQNSPNSSNLMTKNNKNKDKGGKK